MTDLERPDGGDLDDSLERRLVASWKTERPSASSKAATLALFGGVATGAAAAASPKAAGALATKTGATGVSLAAKIAGVTIFAVSAGGAFYAFRESTHAAPASATSAAPPHGAAATGTVAAAAPSEGVPSAASSSAKPSVDIANLPATPLLAPTAPAQADPSTAPSGAAQAALAATARSTPHREALDSSAGPANTPSPPSVRLGAEVAAMDAAREALARGDAAECLAKLATYERSFPDGVLSQEATLLRVTALVQQGNTALARRVADRFLADHPRSPHAQRVQRMLETNP